MSGNFGKWITPASAIQLTAIALSGNPPQEITAESTLLE
jgi:hypothetical protein